MLPASETDAGSVGYVAARPRDAFSQRGFHGGCDGDGEEDHRQRREGDRWQAAADNPVEHGLAIGSSVECVDTADMTSDVQSSPDRNPKRKRRWPQFSLRTLLVVTTVMCVALGWWVNRAEQQRRAVAAILELGGAVTYQSQYPVDPLVESRGFIRRTLEDRLPQDYFDEVNHVSLMSTSVTDADLSQIEKLRALRIINLLRTQATDVGLQHLGRCRTLTVITLQGTHVTDAGLAHLQGLSSLEALNLGHTRVTDAGLAHLQGFRALRHLDLAKTQVTDVGLVHLQGLRALDDLDLQNTQVTDAGLAHLEGLTALRILNLGNTQVTDAGLVHLRGLKRLTQLILGNTKVTDEGRAELSKAMPGSSFGYGGGGIF